MKGTFELRDGALWPVNEETRAILAKFRRGQILVVPINRNRNPRFHGRAFALLHILYDMVETDLEFNPWRKWLTCQAGYFTSIGKVDRNGVTSVTVDVDSLSFEKMTEDAFQECWRGLHRAFNAEYGDRLQFDELMEWSQM